MKQGLSTLKPHIVLTVVMQGRDSGHIMLSLDTCMGFEHAKNIALKSDWTNKVMWARGWGENTAFMEYNWELT